MAKSTDDFTDVIGKEVVCPVCLEEFKEPKMLQCSHNFCKICLESIYRKSSFRNRLEDIICPECRSPTRIPKFPNGGVSGLPTNRALAKFVEATQRRNAKVEIQKNLATGKLRVELLAKRISDFNEPLRVLSEIHEKANELVQNIRDQEASLCREVGEFYHINCETINKEKTDFDNIHSIASKSVQDAETILQQEIPEPTKAIHAAKTLKEQIKKIDELKMNQDMSIDEDLQFRTNHHANKVCKKFGTLTKKGVSRFPSMFRVLTPKSQSPQREPSQQLEFQEVLPPINEEPWQRIFNEARGLSPSTNAETRLPPISSAVKRPPRQQAPLLPSLPQEGLPLINTTQKGARSRPVVESRPPLGRQRRTIRKDRHQLKNIKQQWSYPGNESPQSSDTG